MKRFRSDFLHILLFVVVVGIFFYQTIFFWKLPVPTDSLAGLYHPWRDYYAKDYPRGIPFKNFLITDPMRQQIPWRKEVVDQWKAGKIPLWNPFAFSGTTLAGNIQAAVFYPLNILFFFFSFPVAWTLLIMMQPFLSGIFLYIYLRYKRLTAIAATLGALAWSFSGFSVAWLTWGTISQTALWLPLILLSIDKFLDGKKRWSLMLILALTMQSFAGHAQIALYCMVFAACYLFVRSRSVKKFILPMGVFICISSVQWIPFFQSIFTSSRVADTEWMKPGFFLPWQHLIQFIVPDFFGNPATLNYWGVWNWAELVGYIGVVPLLFAALAVVSDRKRTMFWSISILVALLFALPTPLSKLPYWLHVPLISSLQPTRLLVLIDFCLAVLAAIGVDMYMKKSGSIRVVCVAFGAIILGSWIITAQGGENFLIARRNLILPTTFFILGATILFIGKKFRQASLFLLLLLASLDLLRFAWKFTPFTDKKYFFPETEIINFLKNKPAPLRVMALDDRIMPPNIGAYFGIETAEGYDPLYNSRYEQFMAAVARGNPDITPPYGFNRILTVKNIDSPIFPYLSVQYILSLEDVNRPFLTKIYQEGETRVYSYDTALPRIYLAENIVFAKSHQKALEALFKGLPSYTAVIEQPLPIISMPLSTSESAHLTSYEGDRIVLSVTTINPRLLVILNQFDSRWKANIDGKPTLLYQANYTFQGIVVPAGTHVIHLYYK